MIVKDKYVTPAIDFTDTKANIEAFVGPVEGMRAVTTDTHESGFYNGTSWVWGSGGDGIQSIVAGLGISIDVTDPDNPIISTTDAGALMAMQRSYLL